MTDGYMKGCCKVVEHAVSRLEQLERALDGLDLFLDVWNEKSLETIASFEQRNALCNVSEAAHIYLDGFRAALDEPVEISAESETETKPDAPVSAVDAARTGSDYVIRAKPRRIQMTEDVSDHE